GQSEGREDTPARREVLHHLEGREGGDAGRRGRRVGLGDVALGNAVSRLAPKDRDRGAGSAALGGGVEVTGEVRAPREEAPDLRAPGARPLPVDQPDLREAGGLRLPEILLDDRSEVFR